MEASRASLLAAVKDVPEEEFYRLLKLGHEEFSVLSAAGERRQPTTASTPARSGRFLRAIEVA